MRDAVTAPALERIKSHIAHLENQHTNYGHRMMYWRLIIDAAHEAHAAEVQQLNEMKVTAADPAFSGTEPVI